MVPASSFADISLTVKTDLAIRSLGVIAREGDEVANKATNTITILEIEANIVFLIIVFSLCFNFSYISDYCKLKTECNFS
jgi:hypothetical protein